MCVSQGGATKVEQLQGSRVARRVAMFFFVDREKCRDGRRDNVAETRGQYVIWKIRI